MKVGIRLIKVMVGVWCVLLLVGCGSSEQQELQQWIAEQRQKTRPKVPPLPAPTQFVPQAYNQEGVVDPFSNQKLMQAFRRDATQVTANAGLIAPELNRRKEPLESVSLDTMVMVGSLVKQARQEGPVALVRSSDGLLYQVRLGNYLGQNYGRVIKISETEVVLREIVQDAAGEWVERNATLQLQERSK